MIGEFLAFLAQTTTDIISMMSYFGVFMFMTFESMIFPVPSELVMPFAGFLAAKGEMTFVFVMVASSLGSIFGSLISYYLGKVGGNALVVRYGKYLLLDESDLIKTERWFKRKGEITILIGRFIPVVRHLISIPAGIGKMNLKKFLIYTLIGATIWNGILAYAGFLLGKNWEIVRVYSEYFTIPVAIILVLLGVYFAYHFIKHKLERRKKLSSF